LSQLAASRGSHSNGMPASRLQVATRCSSSRQVNAAAPEAGMGLGAHARTVQYVTLESRRDGGAGWVASMAARVTSGARQGGAKLL